MAYIPVQRKYFLHRVIHWCQPEQPVSWVGGPEMHWASCAYMQGFNPGAYSVLQLQHLGYLMLSPLLCLLWENHMGAPNHLHTAKVNYFASHSLKFCSTISCSLVFYLFQIMTRQSDIKYNQIKFWHPVDKTNKHKGNRNRKLMFSFFKTSAWLVIVWSLWSIKRNWSLAIIIFNFQLLSIILFNFIWYHIDILIGSNVMHARKSWRGKKYPDPTYFWKTSWNDIAPVFLIISSEKIQYLIIQLLHSSSYGKRVRFLEMKSVCWHLWNLLHFQPLNGKLRKDKNKLGLNWAKLSSNWNWDLLWLRFAALYWWVQTTITYHWAQ